VTFKEDSESFIEFDKIVATIEHRYYEEKISLNDKEKGRTVVLSTLDI
jgi:hypothetical protein